jgi:ATP-dependent phosphofructokinase / diphosphate-dependent phosphofructokinase
MDSIKRFAISTGGGDAPGLNAVIRAAVLAGLQRGWECYGIRDGYDGLLFPDRYQDGGVIPLGRESVRGITHLGGTILGTTNRGHPFHLRSIDENGNVVETDRSDYLIESFNSHGLEALIAIGGDGSMAIAHGLSQKGLRIVGVPKTIDNDLNGTVVTFGFDSAVDFATECIDRLHSTAEAHQRIMVVEVMGRYAGWIAVNAGIAATADAILIPEIPFDLNKVGQKISQRADRGRPFAIVVVAEGAHPIGGQKVVKSREIGRAERLGGIGQVVTEALQAQLGQDARCVVLGHLLRGGKPSSFDRLLALRFGAAAVRALGDGQSGVMVALDPPDVRYVPLEQATERMKRVPIDGDTVKTARDLGISFGD